MRLLEPYGFVDDAGLAWDVPDGAVVDGASIPRFLWSWMGGPWEGKYRNASVIHDWFCAIRCRPWRDTHTMFYNAMLVSGVQSIQARTMFLAVYYAGPSWDELAMENARKLLSQGQRPGRPPPPAPPPLLINPPLPLADSSPAFDYPVNVSADAIASPETGAARNESPEYDRLQEQARIASQGQTKIFEAIQSFALRAEKDGMNSAEMMALADSHGRTEDFAYWSDPENLRQLAGSTSLR